MEKRRYISTQSYEDRKQIERARKEINIGLVTFMLIWLLVALIIL